MSDEAAFLRAIQADPADATAKLVYADWLDERGEPERAEYLRLLASGAADQRTLQELAERAGYIWVTRIAYPTHGGVRYATTWDATAWDEATLYALGRLEGVLETYLTFNERVSDLVTVFRASLVGNMGAIEELCRTHCTQGNPGTLTLEPLADWVTELAEVLRRWLFCERDAPRPHSSLTIETEAGRLNAAYEVTRYVRDVIRPGRAWRVVFQPDGFYALDWTDIVLEATDRVLLLHFWCSD